MSCNIKIGSKESFLKVQIIGNATWNNAKYFFDFIEEHVKAGCHKVLLDLMDCSYFDSTYFGVIVELVELVEAQEDGRIHMANVSDDLMREMKTIGLDKVIIRPGANVATACRYNARSNRATETERVADGHNPIADAGDIGIAKGNGG